MSLITTLGPHLPYLRRYARALTGSQASGDAYVKATLSALVEAPDSLDQDVSASVALYRHFHRIWGSTGAQLDTGSEGAREADKKLQKLAPIGRQAFLLSTMEGFSTHDVEQILEMDHDEVVLLIDQAQKDIEAQLKTKVLIIEDEPIIAADIEGIVIDLGHKVTGIATTRDEAVALAKEIEPGLVLCDIQLADNSSGIDAAHDILGDLDVPLIFITAFPERLLTGDKPEPTYLITKPFEANTVKAAMGQALFFHSERQEELA
jgi:DNA-directed RNA polymerase specialized sigma24 family protein